jgi:hypothetical protein
MAKVRVVFATRTPLQTNCRTQLNEETTVTIKAEHKLKYFDYKG